MDVNWRGSGPVRKETRAILLPVVQERAKTEAVISRGLPAGLLGSTGKCRVDREVVRERRLDTLVLRAQKVVGERGPLLTTNYQSARARFHRHRSRRDPGHYRTMTTLQYRMNRD